MSGKSINQSIAFQLAHRVIEVLIEENRNSLRDLTYDNSEYKSLIQDITYKGCLAYDTALKIARLNGGRD